MNGKIDGKTALLNIERKIKTAPTIIPVNILKNKKGIGNIFNMSSKIPQIASYRTITDGGDGDLGKIHWHIGFHGEEHLNPLHTEKGHYLQF